MAMQCWRRVRRYFYSSGSCRDAHGISIREEKVAWDIFTCAMFEKHWLITDDELTEEEQDELFNRVNDKLIMYYQILRRRHIQLPKPIKVRFSFQMVPEHCGRYVRFRKRDHVVKVYDLLNFPPEVKIKKAWYNTDHLFYVYLLRLSSLMTLDQLCEHPLVGSEKTKWSKGISWMAEHIYAQHGRRMTFLPQEVARFPLYASKIRTFANNHGTNIPPPTQVGNNNVEYFNTALFVDCNITLCCVPGTGPVAPGPNQPRRDPSREQGRSVYNRWGGGCGTKNMTADAPDGRTIFCSASGSMRRNDNYFRVASNIEALLAAAQVGNMDQYGMYGDSIFPNGPHLKSRHHAQLGNPNKDWLDIEDNAMSSARMAVEHHYGESDQFFPMTKCKLKLKISQQSFNLYYSRVLLRNMYVCLYHNKTSLRFNCPPPSLDEYMSW